MRNIVTVALALSLFAAAFAEDKASEADPVTVRLETERISFDFKDAGLNGVVEWLTKETGLKISVSAAAQQSSLEKKLKITARLADVKLSAALRLLFENHGLLMSVEKGVVLLRVKDEPDVKPVTKRIDVRELLARVEFFDGPDISITEKEEAFFG